MVLLNANLTFEIDISNLLKNNEVNLRRWIKFHMKFLK